MRLLIALALLVDSALACAQPSADGARELIEEALRKHAPAPHVYEEQTLVLSDSLGRHSVRTARYYQTSDADGAQKRLLIIDTPADVKGAALLVTRDASGVRRGPEAFGRVFGSDFTIADLEAEQPRDFRYERERDQELERVVHHVLRALPKDESVARLTGYAERRLFLRKDNLYVSRIDYQDPRGRALRRQTFRDPVVDDTGAWRPGMVLMEDLQEGHRTLLKVERRVHSADYVPAQVFALER